MNYSISLWPLTADLDLADCTPCYECPLTGQADAQKVYAAMTYATAATADRWQVKSLAYLVSLDILDEEGIGICQQSREVQRK